MINSREHPLAITLYFEYPISKYSSKQANLDFELQWHHRGRSSSTSATGEFLLHSALSTKPCWKPLCCNLRRCISRFSNDKNKTNLHKWLRLTAPPMHSRFHHFHFTSLFPPHHLYYLRLQRGFASDSLMSCMPPVSGYQAVGDLTRLLVSKQ